MTEKSLDDRMYAKMEKILETRNARRRSLARRLKYLEFWRAHRNLSGQAGEAQMFSDMFRLATAKARELEGRMRDDLWELEGMLQDRLSPNWDETTGSLGE